MTDSFRNLYLSSAAEPFKITKEFEFHITVGLSPIDAINSMH